MIQGTFVILKSIARINIPCLLDQSDELNQFEFGFVEAIFTDFLLNSEFYNKFDKNI